MRADFIGVVVRRGELPAGKKEKHVQRRSQVSLRVLSTKYRSTWSILSGDRKVPCRWYRRELAVFFDVLIALAILPGYRE